jgi:hypothetical protein
MSLLAFCISSPAIADEYFAVTPSGAAEMIFADRPAAVVGQLSSKCIDARWTVIASGPNELVCEAPMNFGQAVLGQLLMGNSYSTPPRRFFRFNIAEVEGVSRVQASGWMELQMAFGQVRRTDFAGPEFHNSILTFLGSAGGRYPVGTTFPHHVMMGVEIEDVPDAGYVSLRVKSVMPDGAAAQAGLQVGDRITKIAKKRFKTGDDYLDATAKAAKTEAYPVEYVRDGRVIVASLVRKFRPAYTERVVASPAPVTEVKLVGARSIADELTKLAKLKEAGLLTDAEFEAQKKKLLQN